MKTEQWYCDRCTAPIARENLTNMVIYYLDGDRGDKELCKVCMDALGKFFKHS